MQRNSSGVPVPQGYHRVQHAVGGAASEGRAVQSRHGAAGEKPQLPQPPQHGGRKIQRRHAARAMQACRAGGVLPVKVLFVSDDGMQEVAL